MNQSIKLILTTVLGFMAALSVHAQVTTSSISGKLVDNEGPVQGAVIIAVHTPSGSQFTAVSDKNGIYRINGITPGGPYTVRIECLGYRDIENTGIQAPLGETVTVDNVLEVESIGLEAVVFAVDANDSGMNIERSGASTSISQRRMSTMPTVSRTFTDIMKLTPQASETSNGFAVGGGNYRSSFATVDGAAFNNAFGTGSSILPSGGSPISLDAIEQMSVNITPFDVRQAGFTGAAINAVTKRGTNEWHASVYNYFNSDQLQGDRYGKGDDEKINLSRTLNNVTGVTVGGPIVKDRLFFFLNAEYSPETTPGINYVATGSDAASGNAARPTVDFMNGVKDFLQKTYGYDPGRYQNYSVASPDWKIMARIDWNINDNHKLYARFSHTVNAVSSSPSSSTSPLDLDELYVYGRTSDKAMYFESSRYIQNQNFTSAALELNSRFLDGALNNTLRLTYSFQNEDRDHYGDVFPTVDILEPIDDTQNGVITSFGLDPFTYGNLKQVSTVIATDEINYSVGINNIIAGFQFEWDGVKNGYMQGGAGYYTYNSWDDFVNNRTPAAFAITFPNNDELEQVYPSFQYMQASLYAQDEITFSDRFKLTAGVRLELPVYPTVPNNNNVEFATLADNSQTMQGLRTDDMPNARLAVSPRVGFNWNILGNRNLILRGGTGIYTGRIPFVWIVSSVGNSNTVQLQYIDNNGGPAFHKDIAGIVNELYGGRFTRQEGFAPSSPTIMDKHLKMPTTWKTSLALDAKLPGGIKATLEGVFNKDIYTVTAKRLGQTEVAGGIQLPGEPEARKLWQNENIYSATAPDGSDPINPMYLTNTDGVNGYYGSFTAQLQKDFNFGLSLMAAYTYSKSMTISDGIGDQVTSAYRTMNYSKNGSNTPELGYSSYVSPNRFIASVSYRIPQGRKGATTLGLFYEGYNHCYFAGLYSYTRHSYVMNNVTNDGGANIPIYIPTDEQLAEMPFVSEENKAAFGEFIANDKYLSRHRGEYSKRGAVVAPWQSRFSFKFAQDINFDVCGKTNTFQIGLDIYNLANLLNPDWGQTDNLSNDRVLTYYGGVYEYTPIETTKLNTVYSTWNMMVTLKYFF